MNFRLKLNNNIPLRDSIRITLCACIFFFYFFNFIIIIVVFIFFLSPLNNPFRNPKRQTSDVLTLQQHTRVKIIIIYNRLNEYTVRTSRTERRWKTFVLLANGVSRSFFRTKIKNKHKYIFYQPLRRRDRVCVQRSRTYEIFCLKTLTKSRCYCVQNKQIVLFNNLSNTLNTYTTRFCSFSLLNFTVGCLKIVRVKTENPVY